MLVLQGPGVQRCTVNRPRSIAPGHSPPPCFLPPRSIAPLDETFPRSNAPLLSKDPSRKWQREHVQCVLCCYWYRYRSDIFERNTHIKNNIRYGNELSEHDAVQSTVLVNDRGLHGNGYRYRGNTAVMALKLAGFPREIGRASCRERV